MFVIRLFKIIGLPSLLAVSSMYGAAVFVSTQSGLSANDSANWSGVTVQGTDFYGTAYTGTFFSAKSSNGLTVNGNSFSFGHNAIQPVCNTCTFVPVPPGFNTGDTLIESGDNGSSPDGPFQLKFNGVLAAGAYVQQYNLGQFTAQIAAYNGSTLLFSKSVLSDINGDPVFLGASDTTADITEVDFSLVGLPSDLAMDTLYLKEAVATPEPATLIPMLFGLVLLTLVGRFSAVRRFVLAKRRG